jgi:Ca-activated chloride channel family protein
MRFEWPIAWWLLVPAAWWLWRRCRRPAPALEFSALDLVAADAVSWRTRWAWLPDALRALAVLLLILALARPQWPVQEELRQREGIAIDLLVDISSSMDSSIPPASEHLTRLDAVKTALQRFILGDGKDLPGRPDDLIGLVTFARYADTISPLTEAHDALADLISHLTIEERPNEDGTAYGDAVTLAAAHLHLLGTRFNPTEPGADVKSRVIVLLTDGENNCGRHLPLEATALAKQWGIRIYVISLADADVFGDPTPQNTPPSMAAQILMRMASETGGLYESVKNAEGIQAIYEKINALEKSRIRIRLSTGWRELFPVGTALALLLLVVEMTLRATVLRRIP